MVTVYGEYVTHGYEVIFFLAWRTIGWYKKANRKNKVAWALSIKWM